MSDIEDENLLDVDTPNSNETPNTFGRNLLRRLGIPHDHTEAEAASTPPPSDNTSNEGDGQQAVAAGVASPLVRATTSIQEHLLDPLRPILRDQQRAESKIKYLQDCLASHSYPQGVQVKVPLKMKEPTNQMVNKWAAILTDCSRQLTEALVSFHNTEVKQCTTLTANTILTGVNVIIPDFIADVEDINDRCDKAVNHLMDQTIYKGRKRSISKDNEQSSSKRQRKSSKNGNRPPGWWKGKGPKNGKNKTHK